MDNQELTSNSLTLIYRELDTHLNKIKEVKNTKGTKELEELLNTIQHTGLYNTVKHFPEKCENAIQLEKLKAFALIGSLATSHLLFMHFSSFELSSLSHTDFLPFVYSKQGLQLNTQMLVSVSFLIIAGTLGVQFILPQMEKIGSEIIRLQDLLERHKASCEKYTKEIEQLLSQLIQKDTQQETTMHPQT